MPPQTFPTIASASPLSPETPPPLWRRFRLHALLCALAVLLCELISRPYAEMGICDDPAYITSARILASTGHVVYVGAAAAMLGAQLYIGAALIKLFGDSFTVVRTGTILTAMAAAFVSQRVLTRTGISDRNSTIGTLAFIISPLSLMLSATFMSDIYGLFGIVLCLYCCLRSLQAFTSNRSAVWICAAVAGSAVFGTARQLAWLGLLVMVPSTLWLVRSNRRVLIAGAIATFIGAVCVFVCLQWFHRQPYSLPVPAHSGPTQVRFAFAETLHIFLDLPFLLLPLIVPFISQLFKRNRLVLFGTVLLSLVYVATAVHQGHLHPGALMEPIQGDWLGIHGIFESIDLQSSPPEFLTVKMRIFLTILSVGGLLGLFVSFFLPLDGSCPTGASDVISWKDLSILLLPFTVVYIALVLHSAAVWIPDRYTLGLLIVAVIGLVRYYQGHINVRLPFISIALIAAMGIYGIAITHNTFSLYRARIRLASEINKTGIPDTSVDNGWEYNFGVELQHTDHISDPAFGGFASEHASTDETTPSNCVMSRSSFTPHIHPIYATSFDPNACYGPAPFAPVHYARWLASSPGTLYVVKYLPPNSPQYRR